MLVDLDLSLKRFAFLFTQNFFFALLVFSHVTLDVLVTAFLLGFHGAQHIAGKLQVGALCWVLVKILKLFNARGATANVSELRRGEANGLLNSRGK